MKVANNCSYFLVSLNERWIWLTNSGGVDWLSLVLTFKNGRPKQQRNSQSNQSIVDEYVSILKALTFLTLTRLVQKSRGSRKRGWKFPSFTPLYLILAYSDTY